MSDSNRDGPSPERFSLRRWSARKLEAARATPASTSQEPAPVASGAPATVPPAAPVSTTAPVSAEPPLPPVETLNFDSDFTAFLSANVAEPVKRQALKKLFSDPRFNVMDGLDVYIDDYSIPSPIEPELVSQLLHAQFTLNPPATRINAQGHVEDVPPEETATSVPADAEAASGEIRDLPDNDGGTADTDPTRHAIAHSHAAPDQG